MASRKSSIFYAPPIYSSDDSSSRDLSFEDDADIQESSNKKEYFKGCNEYTNLDYLNNKKEIYFSQKNQKIKSKTEYKSSSPWISLFSTFFDIHSNNHSNMTLDEIELRCTFLQKCDDTEDKMKRENSKSVDIKPDTTHSNMKKFMNEFSTLKKRNYYSSKLLNKFRKFSLVKIIPSNILKKDYDLNSVKVSNKNQPYTNANYQSNFLSILTKEIERSEEKFKKPYDSNKNYKNQFTAKITESKSKVPSETTTKVINNSRRKSNILELHGLEDATTIFSPDLKDKNKKIFEKNQESLKNDLDTKDSENLNNILSNKFSYMIELDKYNVNTQSSHLVNKINVKPKEYHKHLLDHRDAQKSFEYLSNINKTLEELTENDIYTVNKVINNVRNLCTDVIDKLDQKKKFII